MQKRSIRLFVSIASALGLGVPGSAFAATDITFFAISDTHYGRSLGAPYDSNRAAIVDDVNALPGTPYPTAVGGGPVAVPRGLIMPGDLVDRPYVTRWRLYAADYGLNGEGRVKFPVYDGLGNHDVYNYGVNDTTTEIIRAFVQRNALRKGILSFDPRNLHYSWDWDQVHFIQLNLFGGSQLGSEPQWDPFDSYKFLKEDLEKHVGTSGRPVMVVQHFAVDTVQVNYQNSQKDMMVALLKKYNCIGILHGHTHVEQIYQYQGIDVFSDGAAFKLDFLVFRITDGKMLVIHRLGNKWGKLKFEKSISMGESVVRNLGRHGLTDRSREGFAFDVAGVGRIHTFNQPAPRVHILGMNGKVVRILPVAGGVVSWDRTDGAGKRCPPGVYLVRIASANGPISRKITLP